MCGIFGYGGNRNASEMIINGLRRLEYRGYDSWGVAVASYRPPYPLFVVKRIGAIGEVSRLRSLPDSHMGIGHTRWATHGGVTQANAHPHVANNGSFVLAHNGVVENYQQLKDRLSRQGHRFATQTDTEVIVRLVEVKQQRYSALVEAVRRAFLELSGRNTIIVMAANGKEIIAVRDGSPLVIGVGNQEHFFASDSLAFADQTNRVILVEDRQLVQCRKGMVSLSHVETGRSVSPRVERLPQGDLTLDKQDYAHFMLKEIVEQRYTIREAIQYSHRELDPLLKALKQADRVFTIGAGTASYAAGQIACFLRSLGRIPAWELKSYEMENWLPLMGKGDLLIAVSQSGETADTLATVVQAKKRGVRVAGLVNMMGSTLPRLVDWCFYSRSGPEICVASTKAFTAQLAWGLLVALTVAEKERAARETIKALATQLSGYFIPRLFTRIRQLAERLKDQEHFFVLGKGLYYWIALEAALKVKEISYKHFEGFSAGELKHGVIALVGKGTPVFVIVGEDESKTDTLVAAAQVKARGAEVIGVGSQPNELFAEWFQIPDAGPATPISAILPFQLLAYFLGTKLGYDPDKPRHLAKSVTVK